MNMLTLAKEGLFMLLDKWNGSTAKLMTDPRLLEVSRELKHLMDMCFHFPLNLDWLHSIQVHTDDDLQQYPHVFFTSLDILDASVLDHGITPALLEETQQEANDSLLEDSSCLRNLEIFTKEWYST